MKLIKTIGAWTVVATAIGALLASASYADAPGSEGSSFDKEIAVLTKRGISPARARRALDVQGKVAQANLVSEVEAAMGDAYAGAWFEPATAQVHFGVTSRAGRRAAEGAVERVRLAAVVAYTPVHSTRRALMNAQSHWSKRLANLLASGDAMTGLDFQRSAVIVTLSSSVTAGERAALERQAATAVNVIIEVASTLHVRPEPLAKCKKLKEFEAYCEKTLVSGVGIAPGTPEPKCSAGPMLIEGNETYMLTAGHCFGKLGETGEVKVEVKSAYPSEVAEPEQKLIGKEGSWKNLKADDMAVVKIKPPPSSFTQALPTPVPALLAEWGKKTEEPQAVIGEAANLKGEINCRVGMTTGESCGEILRVNIKSDEGEHMVEDTACARGGDSGGPFFFSNSKVNNVTMQGMLTEGLKCGEAGQVTWYEPLKDEGAEGFGILSNFPGKVLLTTANESRGKLFILPELTAEEKWTGESGAGTIEVLPGGLEHEITCKKDKSEGSLEAKKPLGLFHITLEECKAAGLLTCTGLGEASGVILALGTMHLVWDKLGAERGAGVLLLLEATHFLCSGLGKDVLFVISGEVLCLIKPINSKVKHFEIVCEGSKGDPKETVYWNEAGTEVKMGESQLLTSENEAAGVMSSVNTTALILTIVNREIMG